jgi:hypothetical protein
MNDTRAELHGMLLSIASTIDTTRYIHHLRDSEAADRPETAGAQIGPPTFAAWLSEMCDAASRANCGICWAAPPDPCVVSTRPGSGYPDGYHVGRFIRAHRCGLIDDGQLAALTAGLLPAALVWNTPDGAPTGQDRHTAHAPVAGQRGPHSTEGVPMTDQQDNTRREARRRELSKMSKAELCRMYRRGVRTPEGRLVAHGGGMYPLETWRKDEVISSILGIEYPAPEVNQ